MENASKALMIAGAILLAILLITLGITIFNSSKGINDEASVVGQLMELTASDTADIIEGYTVNRYADTNVYNPSNGYYINYFTGIKIDKDATYIISFDYTIEENELGQKIGCGFGIGINNPNAYTIDFGERAYKVNYNNQKIGEKGTFTFELKPSEYFDFQANKHNDLYLSLRLARVGNPPSRFKVKIENIKIKYK